MASAVVGTLRVLLEANAAHLESEFDKASIKIGLFDKFTQNAGRNLQRMVEQFSGQKIVAEAAKMAAAVERVGGVSSLTERELARVASTVHEATAKLRAMGAEVPPSIAKISTELTALGHGAQKSTGFLSGLGGSLKMLGPLLPVASLTGAVTAVIGLGKAAFESADQIVKLSNKTGLSTDQIQRMQFVAGQTGTTVDALAQASFKLGVTVSEGGTKAKDAIEKLGLSFTAVKNLKPEDQFNTVIKALEGVDSVTERNRLGVALFGKQFSEIATAVAEGYTRMKDEAAISGDAQIRAADAAGDAWDRFKQRLSAAVIFGLGTTVKWLEEVERGGDSLSAAQKAGILISTLWGKSYVGELQKVGQELINTEKQQGAYADALRLMKHHTDAGTVAANDYVAALSAAQKQVIGLSTAQKTQLNAALKIGGEAATDYADAIGLSDVALRLYTASLGKTSSAHTKTAAQMGIIEGQLTDQIKLIIDYNVGWTDFVRNNPSYVAAIMEQNTLFEKQEDVITFGLLPNLMKLGQSFVTLKERIFENRPHLERTNEELAELRDQSNRAATEGLRNLAQSFATLAQIAGEGGLGNALRSVGTFIGAMSLARDAGQGLNDSLERLGQGQWLERITAGTSALASFAGAFAQVANTTNQAKAALGGFSTTAQFALGLGATGLAATGFGLAGAMVAWGIAIDKSRDQWRAMRAAMEADVGRMQHALGDLIGTGGDLEAVLKVLAIDGNWFSPSLEQRLENITRLYNELKKKLEEVNGKFAPLLQSAEELGIRLPDALLESIGHLVTIGVLTGSNVDAFKRLSDAATVDWKKMEDAGKRYGDWMATELGQSFQQARLHDGAKQIINDFDLLTRGGASVGSVLFGMKEEISKLVSDSIKFKTTIPDNMKPWIQNLIDTHQLLDENGDEITDIGKIKFAAPIKTEFEIITDAIKDLITTLGDLASAISNLPRPSVPVPTTPPNQTQPGGNPNQPTPPGEDSGRAFGSFGATGSFLENFGAGRWIQAHGWETVTPRSQLPALARAILNGLIPGVPAMKLPGGEIPSLDRALFNDPNFTVPEELRVRFDEPTGQERNRKMEEQLDDLIREQREFRQTLKISLRDAFAGAV